MKVLQIVNTIGGGGVGIAVHHLHQGLQDIGVTSLVLVQDVTSKIWYDESLYRYSWRDDEMVIVAPDTRLAKALDKTRKKLDKLALTNNLAKRFRDKLNRKIQTLDLLPLSFYPNRIAEFHSQWLPDAVAPEVTRINPDLINLHWICGGYLQIETLPKINKPLVWTIHDMWPFTGGCIYNGITLTDDIQECNRYTNSCGACPQLGSNKNWDLSRWVWQRKSKAWKELNLTIVTPSKWLADCARASSLFRNLRVEVIPNGLDAERFKPINKWEARKSLNLPHDKKIVLFGAASNIPRKGFHLLDSALKYLSKFECKGKIELLIFGAFQQSNKFASDFRSHYLGRLKDDHFLTLAYSAADVMVVPSLQESFGQTASESLACGTPVVTFNATGLKDIVDHEQNGYLAKPYEIGDLARGIAWVLEDCDRQKRLAHCAREKVEQEFTP